MESKLNIEELSKIIQEQRETIQKLEKNMDEMRDNVFILQFALKELGASMFNQETQMNSWLQMRKLICPKDEYQDVAPDSSKWTTPTTRQGDDNDRRINELEKKIEELQKIISEK